MTGEELTELLKIFVSQTTCEEREKTILAALEQVNSTNQDVAGKLANIHTFMTDLSGDHGARLGILEEDKKNARRRSAVQLTVVGLIIAIVGNLKAIGSMFKSIMK